MIIEFLLKLFVDVIFEGVLLRLWRLIGNGLVKLEELIYGSKRDLSKVKLLNKEYLYKEVELTEDFNEELKTGHKGTILEIIDENQFLVEFIYENERQIKPNNYSVVKVDKNQFRLKK